MVGLPLLKLGGLAVKTLAKPVVRACTGDRSSEGRFDLA